MTDARSDRPTRGRTRERVILAAVIELLGELGYDAMTMDAVAARAHASKTTIYRRWPGKPELVRAAVDTYIAGRVLTAADTGSLRSDLMAVMRAMRSHLTEEFLALMSGLIHAMRQDQALARVLWTHLMQDASVARVIIDRAVARAELPGGDAATLAALTHEVIEAQLMRRMAAGLPADQAFAAHVVDDLVLPVLTNRPPART